MPREEQAVEKQKVISHLRDHLTMLTRTIGERSVRCPDGLEKSAAYIQAQFEGFGIPVQRQHYHFGGLQVSNVVGRLKPSAGPAAHFVLGAHYDSVAGTVGADDNASAVAVLLETARAVQSSIRNVEISFAAFTLEEPPAYGSRHMGSRVFASRAKEEGLSIDGMICLEMVGFTCREKGCQRYPFPLQFLGYPKVGNFIGIVGNVNSRTLTGDLRRSFQRNPDLPVVALTVPINGWLMPSVRLSDHASFWNKGYRAVMVTDSAFYRNPHYHQPSDTMQTLDFDFMAELVESLYVFFSSQRTGEI